MTLPLYVETSIAATTPDAADELWLTTQHPALHPLWDLRFSSITPTRVDAEGHQELTYALALPHPRLALVTVRGTGTSVGERRSPDGAGSSALTFRSDSALSPLAEGSGYWRYSPGTTSSGEVIRFVTGYDYRPAWGALGRLIDPWLVRPLVWWATAWSFDRLRLWVETGQHPARSRELALAWVAARTAVVTVGLAQGVRASGWSRWCSVVVGLAAVVVPPPSSVPSASRCRSRPERAERRRRLSGGGRAS